MTALDLEAIELRLIQNGFSDGDPTILAGDVRALLDEFSGMRIHLAAAESARDAAQAEAEHFKSVADGMSARYETLCDEVGVEWRGRAWDDVIADVGSVAALGSSAVPPTPETPTCEHEREA